MPTEPVEIHAPDRRPLASRSSAWAQWLAARLARSSVTPNQISLLSVVFAVIGGALIAWGTSVPAWLGAAVCVQLRLVCNLLDGMVAIEGGKASDVGALYNELPDRVSDTLLLVPLGYAVGWNWLGWACALAAALTAYVRLLGGALGQRQDFGGVMAKQRRMATLTFGLIAEAIEASIWGSRYALLATAVVILAGSLVTCLTRTGAIARRLQCA